MNACTRLGRYTFRIDDWCGYEPWPQSVSLEAWDSTHVLRLRYEPSQSLLTILFFCFLNNPFYFPAQLVGGETAVVLLIRRVHGTIKLTAIDLAPNAKMLATQQHVLHLSTDTEARACTGISICTHVVRRWYDHRKPATLSPATVEHTQDAVVPKAPESFTSTARKREFRKYERTY